MKRWFISLYLMLLAALVVVGLYGLTRPLPWAAPAGMFLAAVAPLTFFVWLASARPARTEAHPVIVSVLSGLGAVVSMMAVYRYGDDLQPYLIGGVLALAGWLAYVTWYSRQPAPVGAPIPGEHLPEFTLIDADGSVIGTDALHGHNAVLLFYRGNWCPLCTAQIRELAAAWRKMASYNARIWFISSQSQKHTREMAQQFSIPAKFLRDPDNRVAKKLGIAAPGATPAGLEALGYPADSALPTVVVVDEAGLIKFLEVAENYRLRPDPDTYLKYLMPREVE
jgi:peroxiredoxin